MTHTMVKGSSTKTMCSATIITFLVLTAIWEGREQVVLAIDASTGVVADVNQLQWRDVRNNLTSLMSEYCGSSRLCENLEDDKKCGKCDTCWCDDACMKYGDCCIDKLIDEVILHTTLGETLPFEVPDYKECVDARVRIPSPRTPSRKYSMITSCLDGQVVDKVEEDCDHSGDINQYLHAAQNGVPVSQTSFWSNWPVYSSASKISYKNRACAQCHGDASNLIPWDLTIGCADVIVSVMSLSEYDVVDYVLAQPTCSVTFNPPAVAELRTCTFDGVSHDVCNATGERVTYDPVLWKACEVFAWPYRSDGKYRNVFCLLCQREWTFSPELPCGNEVGTNFFLVISPGAVKRVADAYRHGCACDDDQVWDPYTSRCRNLHCRPGTHLSHDPKNGTARCLPEDASSQSSMGLAYDLHLNIFMTSNRTMPTVTQASLVDFAGIVQNFLTNYLVSEDVNPDKIRTQTFVVYYTQEDNSQTSNGSRKVLNSAKPSGDNLPLTFGLSTQFFVDDKVSPPAIAETLLALDNHTWYISYQPPGDVIDLPLTLTSSLAPGKPSVLENVTLTSGQRGNFTVEQFALEDGESTLLTARYLEAEDVYQLTEFLEVRNTLLCPFLVADDSLGVRIKNDSNGTFLFVTTQQALVHTASGLELSFRDFYENPEGKLILCASELMRRMKEKEEDERKAMDKDELYEDIALAMTSFVCLTVSCLCLLVTLMTYFLFRSLRTLPGKNIMALVVCLLGTMFFTLMSSLPDSGSVVCQAVGVGFHFFFLCSIAWMVIGSWHVHRVFSHVMGNSRTHEENARLFVKFCLMAFLCPILIVTATIVTNVVVNNDDEDDDGDASSVDGTNVTVTQESFPCPKNTDLDIGYGQGVCYISDPMSVLLAAVIPLALGVGFNFVLYARTIWSLTEMTSQQKMLGKDQTNQIRTYVKLATLTCLNWIPGLVGAVVELKVLAYLFVLLAGLQGLFVFSAFVLNWRVVGLYKSLLTPGPKKKKDRKYISFEHNAEIMTSTPDVGRKTPVSLKGSGDTASTSVDSPVINSNTT